MKALRAIALVGFLVAVPLFLVMSNLRLMVLSPTTYESGFARYGAARATGMSQEELTEARRQLIAYFQDGEAITLHIRKEWGTELLFNERELAHLADVRSLFQLAFRAQEASGAYMLAFAVVMLFRHRQSALVRLARYLLAAGLLTLAIFAVLAVIAAVDFDNLFLRFHLVSFTNDLWQLDPRTDYMIRMFPQGFWFEAAMRLATWSMAEGIALVGLTWGYLRWNVGRA